MKNISKKGIINILFCLINITMGYPQDEGDNLFNSSQIHTLNIIFSEPYYWDTLKANYKLDKKMLAQVEINGVLVDSVGVQFKGNSSYNAQADKKSFKIDFNEFVDGQKYDGLKVINLNNGFKDPTLMREKIMLDFCLRNGIPAPRCTYAKLYINNIYWGLYVLVEQVNKTFLEDYFGNKDGNLFKGDNKGTLEWLGDSQSTYYSKYELKTNETENDWADLIKLINIINNTDSESFHDSLETVLNTSFAIKAWAANMIFSNLDSYIGYGHNYYIYHDVGSDKFNWVMWDVNEAFGNFQMGMNVSQIESLSILFSATPSSSRPLIKRMLENDTYKNEFINAICELLQDDFTEENLFPIIDSLATLIRSDLYADTQKTTTNQQFEDNINNTVGNYPGLKSFITNRISSLKNELADYGCYLAGENELEASAENTEIYPNPFNNSATIRLGDRNTNAEDVEIVIYDLTMKQVMLTKTQNSEFRIDRNNLQAGVYFFKATVENEIIGKGKMIIQD